MIGRDWERCYECTGYGDDSYVDENGNFVSNCDTCPYNQEEQEEQDG